MKKFFIKLYRKFIQKKADKIVATPAPTGPISLKWGFVVPHTKAKAGAVLKNSQGKVLEQEYFYGKEMLQLLKAKLPELTVATRDEGGLAGAYGWLNIEGCTASIEPHLNAYNKKAQGYEVLVLKGDELSARYAKELIYLYKALYPNKVDRKVKYVSAGDRGFSNLYEAKKKGMQVALLTELFFIDSAFDYVPKPDMADFFYRFLEGKDV